MIYRSGNLTIWWVRIVSDSDFETNAYPWWYVNISKISLLTKFRILSVVLFSHSLQVVYYNKKRIKRRGK